MRFALRRYLGASAAVLLVVGIGTVFVARALASDIALGDASARGAAFAHNVAAPLVNSKVRAGDPVETATLARLMEGRIDDGSIVHIKLWNSSGTLIWSDETDQVGLTYPLEEDVADLFGTQRVTAQVSDLSKAENVQERSLGTLLEVYAGAIDADGVPMVFESYWSTDRLAADQRNIMLRFAVFGVGALLLLQVALLPLAVTLARRVDRAQAERNRMLHHALSASDLERRRIARDLHDGLIQDLSGLGYALPLILDRLPPDAEDARRVLGSVSAQLPRDVIALRALLTEIYPADLADGGLETAVETLAQGARSSGLTVEVSLGPGLAGASRDVDRLLYRVIREALRNVVRHARATRAGVIADVENGVVHVSVSDDGVGPGSAGAPTGHVGLRLLTDTLSDVRGRLSLAENPDGGTTLRASFPLALAGEGDLSASP